MAGIWTAELRKDLEYLLKKGFCVSEIVDTLHISRMTILAELRRGLDKDEYKKKHYTCYSPGMAAYNQIIDDYGKENINLMRRYEKEMK